MEKVVGGLNLEINGVKRDPVKYLPQTRAEAQRAKAELYTDSPRSARNRPSLQVPYSYHDQVKKIAEMDRMDALFHRLVERLIEFASVGGKWQLPVPKDASDADREKIKKEEIFWNEWSSIINFGVPNVLPGKDEIDEWIVRNIYFNAMSVIDWTNDTIKIGDGEYHAPTKMMVHNPLGVSLTRNRNEFASEKTWIYTGEEGERVSENSGSPIGPRLTDVPQVPTGATLPTTVAYPDGDSRYTELPPLRLARDPRQAFALKYQWSPADNTAAILNRGTVVGPGLYPKPPFIGLLPTTLRRQALSASDVAILDSLIEAILVWTIGDATILKDANNNETLPNQPKGPEKDSSGKVTKKSTIGQVKEQIGVDKLSHQGGMVNLYLPYHTAVSFLTLDTVTLLNSEKYNNPFVELLNGFGIFAMPTNDSANKMEESNRQNLEQLLKTPLRKIKGFWEALARVIVGNNDELTIIPQWDWNPLNTITDKYRAQVNALAKQGRVSPQTQQEINGLNPAVEIENMRRNIEDGTKKLLDESTPVTFVQKSTTGAGTEQTSSTTSPDEGRPEKEPGDKKRS